MQEEVWQMNVHCETLITVYDPRFFKILVLVCRRIMSIFSTHVQWLPVPTAWLCLRLRMEETDCRYRVELRIFRIGSREQQTRGGPEMCWWTRNLELFTVTNLQVTKCYTGSWILGTTQTMENGHGNWNLEC